VQKAAFKLIRVALVFDLVLEPHDILAHPQTHLIVLARRWDRLGKRMGQRSVRVPQVEFMEGASQGLAHLGGGHGTTAKVIQEGEFICVEEKPLVLSFE
jgi:hypothetical protein